MQKVTGYRVAHMTLTLFCWPEKWLSTNINNMKTLAYHLRWTKNCQSYSTWQHVSDCEEWFCPSHHHQTVWMLSSSLPLDHDSASSPSLKHIIINITITILSPLSSVSYRINWDMFDNSCSEGRHVFWATVGHFLKAYNMSVIRQTK